MHELPSISTPLRMMMGDGRQAMEGGSILMATGRGWRIQTGPGTDRQAGRASARPHSNEVGCGASLTAQGSIQIQVHARDLDSPSIRRRPGSYAEGDTAMLFSVRLALSITLRSPANSLCARRLVARAESLLNVSASCCARPRPSNRSIWRYIQRISCQRTCAYTCSSSVRSYVRP